MEMIGLMLFIIFLYFAIIAIGIINCVLTSLSLYTIADRRQIPNPWMAWIPFAGSWLIGNIVDDYEARNGFQRKWRMVLLVLTVLPWVLFMLVYAILFAVMISMIPQMQYMTPTSPETVASMVTLIVPIYVLLIAVMIAMFAGEMCKVICMYKIFESTVPQKAVKYILLYLLVPLAGPICLLKCRRQGYEKPRMYYGMPPYNTPYQQRPMNQQ